MPDVEIDSSEERLVTLSCDGEILIEETLWPVAGVITLTELGPLLEPYARKQLLCEVVIETGEESAAFTALYAMADVGIDAEDFYSGYFLSILLGPKLTAMGRRESLWYYGDNTAIVVAEYDDGSTRQFNAVMNTSNEHYSCIDASPAHYVTEGKTLVRYTVQAGARSQVFDIDLAGPDCAPILEFYNSFGVYEMIYCTGTHKVSPEYKRSTARIGGLLKSYKVEETRKFEADTGVLTTPMATWADELFRSDEVYILNVINGTVTNADGGKPVIISESKSEVSNEDDDMPHFSFAYQYAQRIHNVLQLDRVGRIFDNTFDHTFN